MKDRIANIIIGIATGAAVLGIVAIILAAFSTIATYPAQCIIALVLMAIVKRKK